MGVVGVKRLRYIGLEDMRDIPFLRGLANEILEPSQPRQTEEVTKATIEDELFQITMFGAFLVVCRIPFLPCPAHHHYYIL